MVTQIYVFAQQNTNYWYPVTIKIIEYQSYKYQCVHVGVCIELCSELKSWDNCELLTHGKDPDHIQTATLQQVHSPAHTASLHVCLFKCLSLNIFMRLERARRIVEYSKSNTVIKFQTCGGLMRLHKQNSSNSARRRRFYIGEWK